MNTFSPTSKLGIAAASLLIVSILLWMAYRPAFQGPFVFDDVPNLSPMATYGDIDNRENFARWLDTGDSGPLGRPLALVSFLIEDDTWPTDAGPYRRDNLLLHLLNAVLVGLLMHRLVRLADRSEPTPTPRSPSFLVGIAVTAATIWACLPIQTATVLLVVQRMTLLFSCFVLMALLAWLRGRDRLDEGYLARGIAWQVGGIVVFGALAALAKETAAVLPFLLLALTLTLAPLAGPPVGRRLSAAMIGVGCITVVGVVAAHWPIDQLYYKARAFDVWDRLYSQPLILADYLRVGLLPGSVTLFHDDFQAFDPRHPSLLPSLALLTLVLALALAWQVRRRHPVLAFAILFFFGGHWLEAGPSPLELYFLHRNYLPLLAPVLGLVWAVAKGLRTRPVVAGCLAVIYLGLCLFGTWTSAKTWSSEAEISLQWVVGHPGSIRASSMAANYWGVRGHPDKATAYLDAFLRENPNRALAHVGAYYMHCRMGRENRADWDRLIVNLPHMEYDNTVGEALSILQQNITEGRCKQITNEDVLHAFDIALSNPAFQRVDARADLHYKKAQMFFTLNRPIEGLAEMEQSERIRPNEFLLREQARLLAYYGRPREALAKYQEALDRDPRGRWQRWLGVSDARRRQGIAEQMSLLRKQLAQRAPEINSQFPLLPTTKPPSHATPALETAPASRNRINA